MLLSSRKAAGQRRWCAVALARGGGWWPFASPTGPRGFRATALGAARDHTSPQAHGRSSLEGMPSVHFVLVSFTRKDSDHDDRAVQDDPEQLWGGDIFTGS